MDRRSGCFSPVGQSPLRTRSRGCPVERTLFRGWLAAHQLIRQDPVGRPVSLSRRPTGRSHRLSTADSLRPAKAGRSVSGQSADVSAAKQIVENKAFGVLTLTPFRLAVLGVACPPLGIPITGRMQSKEDRRSERARNNKTATENGKLGKTKEPPRVSKVSRRGRCAPVDRTSRHVRDQILLRLRSYRMFI